MPLTIIHYSNYGAGGLLVLEVSGSDRPRTTHST